MKPRERMRLVGESRTATAPAPATGEAVMFRDADYGALVVETVPRGLAVYDFGFEKSEASAAHEVFRRYGTVAERRADSVRWQMDRDTNALAVISTLKHEMKLRGYVPDKLAERAMLIVKPGEVRRPDLPANGKVIVHDAVEAGIKQHLGLAVASLHEHGKASPPSLRYYARPNAQNLGAVRPPFAVARFFVETLTPAATLREAVLRAMGEWVPHLVKLSVVAEAAGRQAVEVGFAPPAALCESFLDAATPVFEHSNIIGAREVEVTLSHALTEDERKDIEEFGRSCTGCVRITQEGTRLVVQVPSSMPGHYGADHALHERLSWLHRTLDPWGPALSDIGPLQEVDLTLPASPEELAEYKKRTGQQRAQAAKSRVMNAHNAEHQRELRQRRLDWKKNKTGQKKAAVWRARTAAYRNEAIDECGEDGMEHGHDDAAAMVGGDAVATLARRFAAMPPAWWSTPQGEDALRKAKALIKDEHGEEAAKKFEKQLELLKLTSSPTMKAEGVVTERVGIPAKVFEPIRLKFARDVEAYPDDPRGSVTFAMPSSSAATAFGAAIKKAGYGEAYDYQGRSGFSHLVNVLITEANVSEARDLFAWPIRKTGGAVAVAIAPNSAAASTLLKPGEKLDLIISPRTTGGVIPAGLRGLPVRRIGSGNEPFELSNPDIFEAAIDPPLTQATLGRTMLKAAGTFVPAAGAKMDGSDDEEDKRISSHADEEGEPKDEDGDGEPDDEDEKDTKKGKGATEESARPFVLVAERVGASAVATALRSSAAKPKETRAGAKGGQALYFETEREANVFMAMLAKQGFKYGDDFEYDKRPCGMEYVVTMPESR